MNSVQMNTIGAKLLCPTKVAIFLGTALRNFIGKTYVPTDLQACGVGEDGAGLRTNPLGLQKLHSVSVVF